MCVTRVCVHQCVRVCGLRVYMCMCGMYDVCGILYVNVVCVYIVGCVRVWCMCGMCAHVRVCACTRVCMVMCVSVCVRGLCLRVPARAWAPPSRQHSRVSLGFPALRPNTC